MPLRGRLVLAGLRAAALLAFLLLFFGPYMEISQLRSVRSHLVFLVDVSDSMSTEDGYEDEDLGSLAAAAGAMRSEITGASWTSSAICASIRSRPSAARARACSG